MQLFRPTGRSEGLLSGPWLGRSSICNRQAPWNLNKEHPWTAISRVRLVETINIPLSHSPDRHLTPFTLAASGRWNLLDLDCLSANELPYLAYSYYRSNTL